MVKCRLKRQMFASSKIWSDDLLKEENRWAYCIFELSPTNVQLNSSFLYHAWGLYHDKCLGEEYKGNTIILHSKVRTHATNIKKLTPLEIISYKSIYSSDLTIHSHVRMANARAWARVRRFSFFSFTSSPNEDKTLMIKKLKVKAKRRFCSPGEGKNRRNLHTYHSGFQVVKGEGEGWRQEFRTRWVRDVGARVRVDAPIRVAEKQTKWAREKSALHFR